MVEWGIIVVRNQWRIKTGEQEEKEQEKEEIVQGRKVVKQNRPSQLNQEEHSNLVN